MLTKVKLLQHLNMEMKGILDFLHQKLIRPKDLANIMEIGIFIPGFLSSIFLRMSLHTSIPKVHFRNSNVHIKEEQIYAIKI